MTRTRAAAHPRAILAILAISALGGCGEETTGANVVIYSELPAGSLDRIEVRVTRANDIPQERMVAIGPDAVQFPVEVPLRYEAGPLGPLVVGVEGRGPGGLVVTGGANAFDFVVGERLTIPVRLTAACTDVVCGDDERCEEGSCVGVVEPSVDMGSPDGADLGSGDMGPGDLGPPDMGPGVCDPDAPVCYCSLDSCAGTNCDCEGGCACDLSCMPGQDCDHLHCKNSGSRCDVQARGAGNVDVDCDDAQCTSVDVQQTSNATVRCHKSNACCIVDCRGASNCFVDCEPGAYCALDCAGASNCGFSSCWAEGNPLDCGGIRVCGATACPADTQVCMPGAEID